MPIHDEMRLVVALLTTAAVGLVPAAALAADAVSPRDGETVGSRPQFTFDFADGFASVELSHSRDVKTAGDDVGAFVEREAGDFLSIGPDDFAPGFAGPWTAPRINAGRYYWHAKADDYADDFTATAPDTWGPTRTLIVRDEAIVFEGWTARARRGRTRGGCTRGGCTRVLVEGKIVWSDNAASPTARYSVRVAAGGRTVKRLTGTFDQFDERFASVVCTRATRLTLTPSLRDTARHLSVGPVRQLRVSGR
jgi:hypothetical protein